MNRLTHVMSDYSSFRSSWQSIRTRCRMYRQEPGYSSFYPIYREIGSRHAAYQPRSYLQGCSSAAGHKPISRRVRIQFTSAHRLRKIIKASLAVELEFCAQPVKSNALHLAPSTRDPASLSAS
jgi:hypothetical protein